MSGIFYSSSQCKDIQAYLTDEGYHTYILEGSCCIDLSTYFSMVSSLFEFPYVAKTWEGYIDWMEDINVESDKIALIITDFGKMMIDEIKSRDKVIRSFEERIIPWWNNDVIHHVVGGKRKEFVVYILN